VKFCPEPDAGELYVRLDERDVETELWRGYLGTARPKGRPTDNPDLLPPRHISTLPDRRMGRSTPTGLFTLPIAVAERVFTPRRCRGPATQGILARPVQDREDEDGGGVANAGEHTGWGRISKLCLAGC